MTKFLTKSVLAATVAFLATPALAAPAGTSNFDAKAKIVKPVTLTKKFDLDFGTTTMNPSLVSATVTVSDADNSVAVCSSDQLSCTLGRPASFELTSGVAGQTIQISFSNPPTKLDHTTLPGKTVDFTLDAVEKVVLDPAGAGKFNVGGAITVVAATADGEYSANVNIVADYL